MEWLTTLFIATGNLSFFLFFFFKHAVLESFLIQVWISHSLMGVVEDWKMIEDCFDMYCWKESHMRDLVLISFLHVK